MEKKSGNDRQKTGQLQPQPLVPINVHPNLLEATDEFEIVVYQSVIKPVIVSGISVEKSEI